MLSPLRFIALARLLLAALALTGSTAHAQKSTVCTITVNSPEEKDVYRRNLPEDKYQFVELVERDRPDWLASACRRGVQCDVLVISGHFDAGTEFYTDRLNQRESLPVEEMERVACSDSCPGLFSKLKEVHLYGCNTLNAEAAESTVAEIGRTLVRSGHSAQDAAQLSQILDGRYNESNRDTMRRIFSNVPVIYGFSSLAPLGQNAGPLLSRYFQSAPAGEIGSGLPSPTLLKLFGPASMVAVQGLGDAGPRAAARAQMCESADDRLSPAQKVASVHRLLAADMAEARMLFDRIEKTTAALTVEARQTPAVETALATVAADRAARGRYLAFTRNTDRPEARARMIKLAGTLGWLSPDEERTEVVRMLGDQLAAGTVSVSDVDLACALNRDGALDGDRLRSKLTVRQADRPANAGVLACLGSRPARARVLKALTSADPEDVHIAQVYLRHRPLTIVDELRGVTRGIALMAVPDAQVRALETLASHHLADRESLEQLTRLFSLARSLNVQRAIAGVLLRSDYQAISRADVVRVLREYRLKSPEGADLIDVLIRRLLA